MEKKKTLVLGASENPTRYSNLAIKRLVNYNHPVVAIGKKNGMVAGIQIENGPKQFSNIDTVTLYLNQLHQKAYYDYIISLHPQRLIFNPGAENDELFQLALQNGIKPIEACTLVLLNTGQY
ncbi:MAG: CoA-binding protein [Ferruginibacter sp.]